MFRGKKNRPPRPAAFPRGRAVVRAGQFAFAIALLYALADTAYYHYISVGSHFANVPFFTYLSRSFGLYALLTGIAATAAGLLRRALGKVFPRAFVASRPAAAAAGGALFVGVFGLAPLLNRKTALTITHPLMLAADLLLVCAWLVLSATVGARLFSYLAPARRTFGRLVWGVGGYGAAALWAATLVGPPIIHYIKRPPAPPGRLNVLFISIDTLRRDRLGCYGYDRVATPNIDSFAAAATKFDNAMTCAPWTLPAMAAVATGRYPSVCGVDTGHRIRAGLATIAEVLHAGGYRTEAYIGNKFMWPEYGYERGFDIYLQNHKSRFLYPFRGTKLYENVSLMVLALESKFGRVRDDTRFNSEETVAALGRLAGGRRPFFLWCHFMDPHHPYAPPAGYVPNYADATSAEAYRFLAEVGPNVCSMDNEDVTITPRTIELFQMLYDGEVAYVDEQFGKIMAALRARGLAERTVICVFNDHGEEFFDHGSSGHGHTLYPELTDMVLLFRVPGRAFPEGARGAPASQVDIFPTVLDAVGFAPPPELDGRSLLREDSGEVEDRPLFAEWIQRDGPERKAVRRDGWLLIRNTATGGRELYNVAADASATEDLAGTGLPVEEELSRELARWRRVNERAARVLGGVTAMALSEERKAALRGLGYIAP